MNERDRRVADLLAQADVLCLERRGEPLPGGGGWQWCLSCGRVSLQVDEASGEECFECQGDAFTASDVERLVRAARADERRKCRAWLQEVAIEMTPGPLRTTLIKIANTIGGEE